MVDTASRSTGVLDKTETLLSRYTDEGKVDYDQACAAPELRASLQEVAVQDWGHLPDRHHKVAFAINAYNLAAVGVVCRSYRRSRRFRRRGLAGSLARFRFFFLEPVKIAGATTTLAWFEYVTLRRLTRDPRIHFALVCATDSCPPLKDGIYHGARLDQELDVAAAAFLRPGNGYVLDRDTNTLYLNRIFKWYRRDFGRIGGVRAVVHRYAPDTDADHMEAHTPDIRFDRYDWGLNVTG